MTTCSAVLRELGRLADARDAGYLARLLGGLDLKPGQVEKVVKAVVRGEKPSLASRRFARAVVAGVVDSRRAALTRRDGALRLALGWALDVLQGGGTDAATYRAAHRQATQEATRAALARKRSNGEQVGAIRFGFDAADTGRVNRQGKPIYREIPNAKEQAVLVEIFRMRNASRAYGKIADHLNAQHIPTKTGKRWHDSTVRYILSSGRRPQDAGGLPEDTSTEGRRKV